MASPNLTDRSFPLVPHDLPGVVLKCKTCQRSLDPGRPFVPIFVQGNGQQEMVGVLCVYCEGVGDAAG